MKARHLVFFILIIVAALCLQQFNLYLSSRDAFSTLQKQNRDLSAQIEKAMYQEVALREQLAATEQRYNTLRERLPQELDEETFLQQLSQLAENSRLKVLSSSTAIYSRPSYSEAQLHISLESSHSKAQSLLRALHRQPRILDIEVPKQSGKKNLNFTVTLYALEPKETTPFTPPVCRERQSGLWLPPLRERIAPLYAAYLNQCHFIGNFGELLQVQQRLRDLQAENRRLQEVIEQLRPATAR